MYKRDHKPRTCSTQFCVLFSVILASMQQCESYVMCLVSVLCVARAEK